MTELLAPRSLTAAELSAVTAELDAVPVPFRFALSAARLPRATFGRMSRTWQTFRRGVEAFIDRHDGDAGRMAKALGLPERLVPMWESLPARDWHLIGRPDMILGGTDGTGPERCVIVDVNAGSLAGLFPLNDMLLRAHQADVLRPEFGACGEPRYLMGRFADVLRRHMTHEDGLIALTYYADEAAGDDHFDNWHYRSLALELARHGLTARSVHMEDIEIHEGAAWHQGRRIGLVHRYFLPDVENPHHMAELARISAAARDGALRSVTGLWGEILATKATLAMLSDEEFTGGLPPSLAAGLAEAVPWTRRLTERHTFWRGERVDLLDWSLRNQHRLVIKPALGEKGRDVLIGRELTAADWSGLIEQAATAERPWVVQELMTPTPKPLSFQDEAGDLHEITVPVVYGSYVLDGEFVGAIRRYGIKGDGHLMINGLQGAIPAPVYWSDDE